MNAPGCRRTWSPGITLAAYAIPVSLAYAALAGLPPQVGVYGYLLGGLGYALLGSSRQLAVGPTSAISLMIAATVGAMADGDMQRYLQIASLAAFTVAVLCVMSWLLRLSVIALLISDSILVGFKIGAGLTIAMTQLPSLFGVPGGGHNFFERRLSADRTARAGAASRSCDRRDRDRAAAGGREMAAGPAGGACRRGARHRCARRCSGCRRKACRSPARSRPDCRAWRCRSFAYAMWRASFRSRPAFCCSPMSRAYPRAGPLPPSMAMRSTCARNFSASARPISRPRSGHGYPVAGGLSQSAVNDKAGAKTPLALVFASITLALCLLYLTDLLENLAESGAVGGGADRNPRLVRFSRARAYVARQPDRLLCRDRSRCSPCCCLGF